jgi:glycosyltransferase involved in cell wall biosynthesis
MKILYFDIWSPKGHYVFNNIHLKALSQKGDVYTVFKEGCYKFEFPHVIPYLEIPEDFYVKNHGYYYTRYKLSGMIKWVWCRVSCEQWDYIILSSYDPFALFISQRFKNAIVIDHNTLGLLDSKIHGFPLRHLSKSIKHIVFNNAMKSRLQECGINSVSVVPHGFLPMEHEELSQEDEKEILLKYSLTPTDKIIFLPSLSKETNDMLGQELYNQDFNGFLKQHGLKLITKSKVKRDSMSNIIILNGYISEKDYQYLFLHSSCNVLLYSKDFKYRTSGVLNECFANNIPCIISDCPGLREYMPYINNENCVFRNSDELKKCIISIIERGSCEYYRDLDEIKNPLVAWSGILK